jgi:ABC-type transport system involved in cytochrome c biogenesis ATPase subunit
MRLRYLQLRSYPLLNDVAVVFSADSPLERSCAIRFVVGVNGSGKSHLLRAISEVFLSLADWHPPPFPVSLVYEIGSSEMAHTLVLHAPGARDRTSLWMGKYRLPSDTTRHGFERFIEELHRAEDPNPHQFTALIRVGEWPQGSSTPNLIALPQAVLAYTTGAFSPWSALWARHVDGSGTVDGSEELVIDPKEERPPGWTRHQEIELLASQQDEESRELLSALTGKRGDEPGSRRNQWRPLLLTPELLKCALLAVSLPQALQDLESCQDSEATQQFVRMLSQQSQEDGQQGLRALFARANWLWPVSISLRMDFQLSRWRAPRMRQALAWMSASSAVLKEPWPSTWRTLHFDLRGKHVPIDLPDVPEALRAADEGAHGTVGEALLALLGGADVSAFERFQRLMDLFDSGLMSDVGIALRKTDSQDILLYDELSDGEQMILGRTALFHLLGKQNDVLLLLDEPETHFNDRWKREIVEVIDQVIGNTTNEVFISTHSALTLTDAFTDEITLLRKDSSGEASWVPLPEDVKTFGATADHPLRDVFDAPDTAGLRASIILNVLLLTAPNRQLVESIWRIPKEERARVQESLSQFVERVRTQEPGFPAERIIVALDAIHHFAVRAGAPPPLLVKDALRAFAERVGPGYFQLDLYRVLRRLEKEEARDAS